MEQPLLLAQPGLHALDIKSNQLIIFEFFGGVGSVSEALEHLDIVPLASFYCDVDPMATLVAQTHHPHIICLPDIKVVTSYNSVHELSAGNLP